LFRLRRRWRDCRSRGKDRRSGGRLPFDCPCHVVDAALEQRDVPGEPVAVRTQGADLRGQHLGFQFKLGDARRHLCDGTRFAGRENRAQTVGCGLGLTRYGKRAQRNSRRQAPTAQPKQG